MRHLILILSCAALTATLAHAQPGGPPGARAAASGASAPGWGPRGAMMGGRWGSDYTPGWRMMTPAERDEQHRKMADARTYEDCRKAIDEHRALMDKRASERGFTLRGPRRDACAGLPKQ